MHYTSIHNCSVGIVFLSKSALDSVRFEAEVTELMQCEKGLVPVCLEVDFNLPDGFRIYLMGTPFVPLYEDETPDNFLADLERQTILAPCRETTQTADSVPFRRAAAPVQWALDDSRILSLEPLPAPEGEFQLLLRVRAQSQDA